MHSYLESNGVESLRKLHSQLTIHGNVWILFHMLHLPPRDSSVFCERCENCISFCTHRCLNICEHVLRERERVRERERKRDETWSLHLAPNYW